MTRPWMHSPRSKYSGILSSGTKNRVQNYPLCTCEYENVSELNTNVTLVGIIYVVRPLHLPLLGISTYIFKKMKPQKQRTVLFSLAITPFVECSSSCSNPFNASPSNIESVAFPAASSFPFLLCHFFGKRRNTLAAICFRSLRISESLQVLLVERIHRSPGWVVHSHCSAPVPNTLGSEVRLN